jgi:hypothetical protein
MNVRDPKAPIPVPPTKSEEPLGQINSQLVVANRARPEVRPTTFSISLVGQYSEYLPGQVLAPGESIPYGVQVPMSASIRNHGPSTLYAYIDQEPEPEAAGLPPAADPPQDAPSGRTSG